MKKNKLKISSKAKKVRVVWGFKPVTRIVVNKRKKILSKLASFDFN